MRRIIFGVALFALILFASLGVVLASFGQFKDDRSRSFVETRESWNLAKKLPPDHSEIYVKKKLSTEWDTERIRKNNKGKTNHVLPQKYKSSSKKPICREPVSKPKCRETFFGRICDIPKGKFWT